MRNESVKFIAGSENILSVEHTIAKEYQTRYLLQMNGQSAFRLG